MASERLDVFPPASGGGGLPASLIGSGGRTLIASLVRSRSGGPINGGGGPPISGDCISTTVAGAASTRKLEGAAPFVAAAFEAGGWLAGESAPDDSDRRIATSFGGGRPCRARAVAVGTCRRRWLTSAEVLGTASGDGVACKAYASGGLGG